MTAALPAVCPGCKALLRVPADCLGRPVRCSRCGLVLRLRPPAPPAVPPPLPPTHLSPQRQRGEQHKPAAPAPGHKPAAPAPGRRRIPALALGACRDAASWWKGPALGLCILVLAAGTTAAGWSRLRPVLFDAAPAAAAEEAAPRRARPLTPAKHTSAGRRAPAVRLGPPTFARDIVPLVERYCIRCHRGPKGKGGVVLDRDRSDDTVRKNRALWERVADNLRSGDMPPPGARRPGAAELDRSGRVISEKKDLPYQPFRVYPR